MCACPKSPEKSSGGGGNRKHPISSRFAQLRVITGNWIPSYRNQKTAKSTFGKPLCQLAKSNVRPHRKARTWEACPPPRPWARWRARSCRAHGTRTRAVWRVPCCGYWHVQLSNRDPLPDESRGCTPPQRRFGRVGFWAHVQATCHLRGAVPAQRELSGALFAHVPSREEQHRWMNTKSSRQGLGSFRAELRPSVLDVRDSRLREAGTLG